MSASAESKDGVGGRAGAGATADGAGAGDTPAAREYQSRLSGDATMKALVAKGAKDFRFEDAYPMPRVEHEEEVIVKVTAVGICASDGKMWKGGDFYWGKGGRVRGTPVPGHEFVGEVVALGAAASERWGLKVGDSAVAEQCVPCHSCIYCREANHHKCNDLRIYGQALDGAMAEYMAYRKGSFVHRVPDALADPTHAVFVEPLAVSVHAADRAQFKPYDLVAVGGCGPIGLGVIAAAKKAGATVIALEKAGMTYKLDVARKAGADYVFDVDSEDAIKAVDEMSGERHGCDVYIECSGQPAGIVQGLEMVRKCGRLVHVSIMNEPATLLWNTISAGKELDVLGSSLGRGCWPRSFKLLEEGLLPLDDIITHRMGLPEYVKGFDMCMHPDAEHGNVIKVVLEPSFDSA